MDPFRLVVDQRFGLDFIIIFNPRGPLKCPISQDVCNFLTTGYFIPYLIESMPHIQPQSSLPSAYVLAIWRAGSGSFGSIFLIIRAGLPATTWKAGTSLVTTLPAPMVTPLPIVTPGSTITLPPNQQSSPTVMGTPSSGPCTPLRRNGSKGCVAA